MWKSDSSNRWSLTEAYQLPFKPNTPHNKTLCQKTNKILPKITKQKNKKTHNTQKPQKTKKIQHKLQTNIKKIREHKKMKTKKLKLTTLKFFRKFWEVLNFIYK